MSEWISVTDRLPDDDQNVLFANCHLGGLPSTGWYEKNIGFLPHGSISNIVAVATHWMPLPETPKEEKSDGICQDS